MNWDDFRYVLALSKAGSLARAAKALEVDHTTVGRRVESAERALGVRLFTRTSSGYLPTADAERLFLDLGAVEDAVLSLERGVHSRKSTIEGTVRVTSPETFGCLYLAPRLASLRHTHPKLTIELSSTGAVLDLAREADIAVRFFRSKQEHLVVRRAGAVRYGLYASKSYLARHPLKRPADLAGHPLLSSELAPKAIDAKWLARLSHGAKPAFVCELTVALLEACRAGTGIAVLPRYVGDAAPDLQHLPMPDPPTETLWMTFHRDMKETPRVRLVLDHLARCFATDRGLLIGA